MVGAVGVDVGGTGVRAASVDPGGAVGALEVRSLRDRSIGVVVATIAEVVGGLGPSRVGVGVPGFVRDGRVLASPNFPEWRDVDLGARLEEALGVPVSVENDANAAALGAWVRFGGVEDLVLLTLGTGVGGGVVSEGRLVRGRKGTGAELGHIRIGGAARCGCGGTGCLETWSSTVGLVRLARESGVEVTGGAEVLERARAGEGWAIEAVERAAEALGSGLITLANTFAPERIAIAGGLSSDPGAWSRAVEVFEAGVIPANRCPVLWLGRADELAIAGAAAVRG